MALVRGADYGAAYQALLAQLQQQGRVALEVDALGVARLLRAGLADVTIMTPSALFAALQTGVRARGQRVRLRIEPLDELAWHDSGVYISKLTVAPAERSRLAQLLRATYKSSAEWEQYKRAYPADVIAAGMRPR